MAAVSGAQQHAEKHVVPRKALSVPCGEALDSALQESPSHGPSTGPGASMLGDRSSLGNLLGGGSARENIKNNHQLFLFLLKVNTICGCP